MQREQENTGSGGSITDAISATTTLSMSHIKEKKKAPAAPHEKRILGYDVHDKDVRYTNSI